MHITIFNGPPGSGKDSAADHLVKQWGYHKLEMKGALRKLAHKIASLTIPEEDAKKLCEQLEFDRERKSTEKRPEFGDRTWREFLIWLSEDVCKPIFGADIFSLAAVKAIYDCGAREIVFSDCGFQVEVDTIYRSLPKGVTIDLVHLHREGANFSEDSRGYVRSPQDRDHSVLINDGTIDELYTKIDRWMGYYQ